MAEWTDFDLLLQTEEPEINLTESEEEQLNEYEWQLDNFLDYEY